MEYIYSAMVLYSAGKDITEDAIKAVLTAAGVDADAAKIKALVASLEGVDIKEAIANASVAAPAAAAVAPAAQDFSNMSFKEAKEEWLASFEGEYIRTLLERNGYNISQASRESEIDRKYFRKLMKKYGISADGADASDVDDD